MTIVYRSTEDNISMTLIDISKRDWDDNYWTNSGGARWAFFAIFVVLIIVVVLGTIRVNKKRSQHGMQPIYGTRWMTPPNYRQSQNQYNQPDHVRDPDLPSAYVPIYTATANEYDMGYYDSNGRFHSNPNAKSPIQHPPEAYQRSTNNHTTEGTTINPSIDPPSSNNLEERNENSDHDSINNFYRPNHVAINSPYNNDLSNNLEVAEEPSSNSLPRQQHSNDENSHAVMPGAFAPSSGSPPSKTSNNVTEIVPIKTDDDSFDTSTDQNESKRA